MGKFQPGHPKVGGRQKGSKNKFTRDLAEICEEKGFNPFEALLEMAQNPKTKGGIKLGALKELCEYLYPKRQRMEFEGAHYLHVVREIEELSKLPTEELKQLAQAELAKTNDPT